MRKFIIRLALFGVIIYGLDRICGCLGSYLVQHAKGGDTFLSNYVCNSANEEVMIFGSSRAVLHYDPNIFEDILGITCYNCGKEGNGIILMYGRYLLMSEHHVPKILLYEVTPEFDMGIKDNHTFLGGLRYYYNRDGISAIFDEVDKTEKIKMMSMCYIYNSAFPILMSDNIHPLRNADKGYRPNDIVMDYEPKRSTLTEKVFEYDTLKLSYLQKLIDECKRNGTKLYLCISPEYKANSDTIFNPVLEMAERNQVLVINHYCDTAFVNERNLFKDSWHMNRKGATKYSKIVAHEIKKTCSL